MKTRPLGRTALSVTELCLGTMTWGHQNTEAEGHAQMDLAVGHGVTFWDTAEMYAVPPSAETFGRTEEIIGSWFASRGGRDRILLATKIIGRPRGGFGWIRDGRNRLDLANLTRALDDSLRRLRTDYIDLYQIHWPDRPVALFGQKPADDGGGPGVAIEETLAALAGFVAAGKIRHIGVSNESAWGVMTWLAAAERLGLPRLVSIQNAYNLLNRTFDRDLAEVAEREGVGLLAYSPLAAGTLTGKYLDGAVPPGSRRAIDPRGSRYDRPRADPAVRDYLAIARRHGLDPARMAIAFVLGRPFVTSAIIGATSLAQLENALAAADSPLPPEVLAEIDAVHAGNPDPCP